MKIAKYLLALVVLIAPDSRAEGFEVVGAGNCAGLFRMRDGLLFRDQRVQVTSRRKCSFLVRGSRRMLKNVELRKQATRYSEVVAQKALIRRTSTGYALDFMYDPSICFYEVWGLRGRDTRRSQLMRVVNSTVANHDYCHGAV